MMVRYNQMRKSSSTKFGRAWGEKEVGGVSVDHVTTSVEHETITFIFVYCFF